MHTPYRIGKGVYLRPLDVVADVPLFTQWFNDPEVSRYTRQYLPLSQTREADFVRALEAQPAAAALAIVRREDDRLLGACGLHDIDPRHRHAWFGITIGDKTAWGKGHGTEATRLMLALAFDTLNLNRVFLHVYEFNERARHVYEKLGFQLEGRLRQDCFSGGRYWDTLVMGLLRAEWAAQPGRP